MATSISSCDLLSVLLLYKIIFFLLALISVTLISKLQTSIRGNLKIYSLNNVDNIIIFFYLSEQCGVLLRQSNNYIMLVLG